MRSGILIGIAIFLLLGVTAEKGCTVDIPWSGLPDLAIRSEIIAMGTVTSRDENTIMITERILKGRAPKELNIIDTIKVGWLAVNYVENEKVILFLKSVEANTAYLTSGYLSKWPRDTISEYSNILDRASVESIVGLVNQILYIESKTDLNDRVKIIKGWLDSSDSLLTLVALQYALSSHIWPEGLSPDYQKGITKNNVRKQLSGYAFKLIQSNNPEIQEESIRLLRYADSKSVLPVLINKITDPNKYVREATSSVLFSILHEKDLNDDLKYDYNESSEELLSVQRKWQEWYDNEFINK
ncbi:MAG: HEAT repeat domain-containing protein [Candidatus Zixiibacteriota bacterium]|nr:MAG: HEAT repeat domain-containing protein [candidate division Zixibacteria bacterium]